MHKNIHIKATKSCLHMQVCMWARRKQERKKHRDGSELHWTICMAI